MKAFLKYATALTLFAALMAGVAWAGYISYSDALDNVASVNATTKAIQKARSFTFLVQNSAGADAVNGTWTIFAKYSGGSTYHEIVSSIGVDVPYLWTSNGTVTDFIFVPVGGQNATMEADFFVWSWDE